MIDFQRYAVRAWAVWIAVSGFAVSGLGVAAQSAGPTATSDGEHPLARVVAFGDSFTDTTAGGTLPPRVQARFGRNRLQLVLAQARGVGRLTNYARVGARVLASSHGVRGQIRSYVESVRRGAVAPATLVSYAAGFNDVVSALSQLVRAPTPRSMAYVGAIRDAVLADIARLQEWNAATRIVVATVPEPESLPLFASMDAGAAAHLRVHLAVINAAIRGLDARSPEVVVVDIAELLHGLRGRVLNIDGVRVLGAPVHSRFDSLFGDPIHPSAVLQALWANAFIDRIHRAWAIDVPPLGERQIGALARIAGW